jgi:menaquinol-cytochrome c reductase iron-sulfur subunit
MAEPRPPGATRRRFLAIATAALGGAVGAVLAVPLVRAFLHPVGKKTVISAAEPVDVIALDALAPGAAPTKVQIAARSVRDAWSVTRDVPLGSAWVRRTAAGDVQAFSSACPHLGCAIGFDPAANVYKCPCHRSAFSVEGEKLEGPSKRGLDPLPVKVEDGRVKLTLIRFRADVAEREPV